MLKIFVEILFFKDVAVVTNGAAQDNVGKVKVTVMNIVTAYLDWSVTMMDGLAQITAKLVKIEIDLGKNIYFVFAGNISAWYVLR